MLRPTLLTVLFALSGAPAAQAQSPGPWLDDIAFDAELADTGAPDADEPVACPRWILRDGVELPELPELYHRMRPSRAWGTPELVNLLLDTAAEVAFLKPDADRIVIGDLSRKGGGDLRGHRSHKGGIDADLGLYFYDGRQHQYGFLEPVLAAFDVETNWLVIRTMLDSGMVERILIDQSYLLPLKRHAIATGDLTPAEAREIFVFEAAHRWRTGTVHHAPGHRDHLHIRVKCFR